MRVAEFWHLIVGGSIYSRKIRGGIQTPNGPFIAGDYIGLDYGTFKIGVSHNACYFPLQ